VGLVNRAWQMFSAVILGVSVLYGTDFAYLRWLEVQPLTPQCWALNRCL